VDDLHDPPSDSERNDLEARVRAAADAGRISAADRDIRLGNVRSAQSRTELDLMRRDLDQLDASVAPTAPAAPYSTFDPAEAGKGPTVEVSGSPRAALTVVAVVVAVLGVVAAIVAVAAHHVTSSTAPSTLPPAQSSTADPVDTETSPPSSASSTGPGATTYSLSAAGIRSFLATYQKKFGTSRVVDLVMYPTYAVVDVPVAGGRGRQQGWVYRQGAGWTGFGGVRAVFPGSSTVDTRQLDVDALVRNIRRARATLKVEQPTQSYVILRFVPQFDPVPSVDIHVANSFNESGYLATRLDGTVERAYPFGE
jgi:hypothetical protein